MTLRNIGIEEFMKFQKNHELSNLYQTINYGMLMSEYGYDYDIVGLCDDDDNIIAASLILIKPIGLKYFYGYAPRGFLLDFENDELLTTFTIKLKEYYSKKNVIFIKINPNIAIGEIDKEYTTFYNPKRNIPYALDRLNYNKLKNNLYFEASLPHFNAFVDLRNYNFNFLSKNTKNKIRKSTRKGLIFKRYPKEYINEFYEIIKPKVNQDINFYKDLYTVYEKNDAIDMFLISIDYYDYLQNSQQIYNEEENRNYKLNKKIAYKNDEKTINAKMNSDKTLLTYKNDIMEATKGMQDNKEVFIAGAIVIKHNNTVTIFSSGYNKEYKRYAANYFLYNCIINYYKEDYDYLDLNGIVGDFKNENQYTGLNRFKIGFNPKLYEFIGEFDLIINDNTYNLLLNTNVLAKEFSKKNKY